MQPAGLRQTALIEAIAEGMRTNNSKSAAIERALKVLDAFHLQDRYLSLAELCRRTNIAKATLLRILPALNDHHLICRAENGTYFVGPASLRLSAIHNATVRREGLILPALMHLVKQTGETAAYSIRQSDFLLYIYRKNSPHRLRAHVQTGDIVPLDRTATGDIILAFEDRADPKYAALREQMYAIGVKEIEDGIVTIACPVFDHEDAVVGALLLSGPSSRIQGERVRELTATLLKSAAQITSNFGGSSKLFTTALKRDLERR